MSEIEQAGQGKLLEARSIDYIPDSERHGSLWSQFTLWFGANLQITAIVVGAIPIVMGADVFWSIIGLFIGQIFGGTVMALHGAQGPRLGLPQMISSRVQFGVYGAVIPIILVCMMYIGFSASGSVLAGQAIGELLHIPHNIGILIFGVLIILFTLVGYRLIHVIGKLATVLGIITFCYMFYRLLSQYDIVALLSIREFSWKYFLLSISLAASWQIAFGPYVADYSRYLPRSVSKTKVFFAVGCGSVFGTQISMIFGILAAAQIGGANFSGNEVQYIVGLSAIGWVAALLYLSIAFGKVVITTLNAYGSFMSMATITSGFTGKSNIKQTTRFFYIVFMVGISVLLAILGRGDFLNNFTSFLGFLLTFFTPWSAINLIDYYWVTKERYDVPALSDPNGRYGKWNMIGISTYIIGVLVQIPFISTGFYSGFLLDSLLQGVDISWIIGLIVPGILYYVLTQKYVNNVPDQLILPKDPS